MDKRGGFSYPQAILTAETVLLFPKSVGVTLPHYHTYAVFFYLPCKRLENSCTATGIYTTERLVALPTPALK